ASTFSIGDMYCFDVIALNYLIFMHIGAFFLIAAFVILSAIAEARISMSFIRYYLIKERRHR
ncbi:hypothetical protein MCHI_003025, partial [Candidatus Magnetoovum chiemensis]